MPDRLVIQDLSASCRLGISEWEQEKPQTIWIDLELAIDASRAARRDEVGSTIDYARLVDSVKRVVEARPYRLLETVAEHVAALVLEQFETRKVMVRVRKRALEGIGYAAVEVERPPLPSRRAGRGTASRALARARRAKALRRRSSLVGR